MRLILMALVLGFAVSCTKQKVAEPAVRKIDILSEEDIEEFPESK